MTPAVNAQPLVESAEVTVQYINPPREGKSWGNVKDTKGESYWGPPAMLARYTAGETCRIEYTMSKDGKFKNLRQKVEIPKALQRVQPAAPRAPTNPTDSEQMFVTALLKPFIELGTVVLQRDSLKNGVSILREAYADTFGSPAKQKSQDEFQDMIEY